VPSTDFYTTAIAFLVGDGGDIRAKVNAEQENLLPAGSVIAARFERHRAQRRENAPTPTIEVVLATPPISRKIGVGVRERDLAFDLRITARLKAGSDGATQAALVQKIVRALLYRYVGATNLAISGVHFRRSHAEVTAADDVPASSELIRSVVRLTLTFSDVEASNDS